MFLAPPAKPAYVICLIDSCSRLAWAETVTSKKALPVMFKALKILNSLNVAYGLAFAEILTDNGAEFAARAHPDEHPFEQMLLELGIKHRYTRPYRPQTNGKAERFWRTLNDDVIDGATFDHLEHFANELFDGLLQQPPTPSGPRRQNPKGSRRENYPTGPISELVNLHSNERLERISGLIDWERVGRLLRPVHPGDTGRPPYEPLAMFRALLPAQWYGLSDPMLEESLTDRVSFRRFYGFALDAATPDETTLCRFRDALKQAGLGDALFDEILRQLDAAGFILKAGMLVDATLVRSAARAPPSGSTPRGEESRSPHDPDANWTRQGHKRATFSATRRI